MRKAVPCWARCWGAQARVASSEVVSSLALAGVHLGAGRKVGLPDIHVGAIRIWPAKALGDFKKLHTSAWKRYFVFFPSTTPTPTQKRCPLCFHVRLLWLILKNEVSR